MSTVAKHAYDNGTLQLTFNLCEEDEIKENFDEQFLPLNKNTTPVENESEKDKITYYLDIEFRDLSSFNTFNKKYTFEEIADLNPLFQHNPELLFDLFENKPDYFNITENILTISYILKIGKRKYNIKLEILENVEEGENEEINKLRLQNEFLSKKIFKLEQEHKKTIVVNILTNRASYMQNFAQNFELFKQLISTNFDINCDLHLYSPTWMSNIFTLFIYNTFSKHRS